MWSLGRQAGVCVGNGGFPAHPGADGNRAGLPGRPPVRRPFDPVMPEACRRAHSGQGRFASVLAMLAVLADAARRPSATLCGSARLRVAPGRWPSATLDLRCARRRCRRHGWDGGMVASRLNKGIGSREGGPGWALAVLTRQPQRRHNEAFRKRPGGGRTPGRRGAGSGRCHRCGCRMDPLQGLTGHLNDLLNRVLKSGRECRHSNRWPDPPQGLGGAPADTWIGTGSADLGEAHVEAKGVGSAGKILQ